MVETIDCTKDISPIFRHHDARLTEGITYCGKTDVLYWIDIYRAEIHRIHDYTRNDSGDKYDKIVISQDNYNEEMFGIEYPKEHLQYKESIGVVFPHDDPERSHLIYFGSKFGIGQYDYHKGTWGYILLYTSCPTLAPYSYKLRSNDGNITPDGKYIIIGLMEDFMFDAGHSQLGCVLKIDLSKGTIKMLLNGMKIPNAFYWNHDSSKLYVTDSLNHMIWEYSYDPVSNELIAPETHRVPWFDIKKNSPGFQSPEPDGGDIDIANGLVFISVWSTSQVQVYDLNTGDLMKRIMLPETTPRISCCCLVGNDLLITTANMYITDKEHQGNEDKDKQGGCLYKVANVTSGVPQTRSSKLTLLHQ